MAKGTYHLADNPALYEPARTNNFEFLVSDIDDLLLEGTSTKANITEKDHIRNGQEVIRISVSAASVPHYSMGVIDVKRGNNTMHFAGTPTFNNQTLVLNDYMGARTKDVLLAWKALSYDVGTEKVQRASKYKKNCQLIEYTPDYEEIVRVWDMKGCWISELDEDQFNHETNEKKTITATIVYDKAIPHLPDEEVVVE